MSFSRSATAASRQLQRSLHTTSRTSLPAAAVKPAPVSRFSRTSSRTAASTPPPSAIKDDPPSFADFDFADASPTPTRAASSSSSAPKSSSYSSYKAPPTPAALRAAPVEAEGEGTPTASPPLRELPGAGYKPLPSPQGIPGEMAVTDWTTSFSGLSDTPFPREVAEVLLKPLDPKDIEIKPDGLLYLPEIKYRRTLNLAFGPGGWGLAPRGESTIENMMVSREWGLVCLGRLVSVARGEQEYFSASGIPTASEACKSNALMRCCKDLGIASELWDPVFIRDFKSQHCVEVWAEHYATKKKKKLFRKKSSPKFSGSYNE